MIKPDDVKQLLLQYCETQLMQLSTSYDENDSVPPSPSPSQSPDMMFKALINDGHARLNQICLNIQDFHSSNSISDDDTFPESQQIVSRTTLYA